MGSIGDCFDNSVAESFFATLQTELLDRSSWPTRKGLAQAVFAFISEASTTRAGGTPPSATSAPPITSASMSLDALPNPPHDRSHHTRTVHGAGVTSARAYLPALLMTDGTTCLRGRRGLSATCRR
jgi:hypothetical protein